MVKFTRLHYEVKEFPIANAVREILGVEDLENLEPSDHVATRETDQKSPYHKPFYENLDIFLSVYRKLAEALLGREAENVYIQRVPTFRVHLRNSVAVGTWHRDRDFGHQPNWVPLTRAFGNNTVWIEGEPAEAEYGDVVVFDGANSLHGNKINDTAFSRVSVD